MKDDFISSSMATGSRWAAIEEGDVGAAMAQRFSTFWGMVGRHFT
jgi:hypothetical protein